ncbi:MAG: hypothetical protein Q8Q09_27145 [Deltaproteobacteria bacterium]|nr:hypothetical protein [Deltaproteobacteria bacterium]
MDIQHRDQVTHHIVRAATMLRRDELLAIHGGIYVAGVKTFEALDATRARRLVEEGYLVPALRACDEAPDGLTVLRFLERWCGAALARGFARGTRPASASVFVDGLSLSQKLLDPTLRDRAWWEFEKLSVQATLVRERCGVLEARWEVDRCDYLLPCSAAR